MSETLTVDQSTTLGGGVGLQPRVMRRAARVFDETRAAALFDLAGIEVASLHELPNGYWPKVYAEEREESPWWLALTEFGPVKIGWRKRVLNIDWTETQVRHIVTEDDTTKDETMVHAWGYDKAIQYLTAFRRAA